MFETFTESRIRTQGADLFVRTAGDGPPLLLLHGFPETGACWHKVAPALARRFTLVVPDLRGYGRSQKLPGDREHATYSKRALGTDAVELMAALGFPRFAVAGHDRGGRIVHRMAIDHAGSLTRAAVLDIVPTLKIFESFNQQIATQYYHWTFLAQPSPLPEHLIGLDPDFYLERTLGSWGTADTAVFTADAMAEYRAAIRDPATIHAMCEDYRAAATIDLVHHREDRDTGRRIACPLLVLWGANGIMEKNFDVLGCWRDVAADVRGHALACGHFLPEEKPAETAAALADFFAG